LGALVVVVGGSLGGEFAGIHGWLRGGWQLFGNQGFAYVGPSNDIHTLITDSGTDEKHLNALRESGVQVIVAGRPDTRKSADRTRATAE